MKYLLLSLSALLLSTFVLGCQGKEKKRESVIKETQSKALQLFDKDGSSVAFDSVAVKKINANKDSLLYYKDKKFIGSSVIVYE
jgi:hypothetical protein